MDAETIQKIAAEVTKHLPTISWLQLGIQVVLTIAAAGIGAFCAEYLKVRGQHLATKADFDDLTKQLRANTELVETIKSDVGQRDWTRREWTNLRRLKLEELLLKMNDCDHFRDLHRASSIDGVTYKERDPIGEMDTLCSLYFPELRRAVSAYMAAHRAQISADSNLVVGLMKAGQDTAAQDREYEVWGAKRDERFEASRVTTNHMNEQARALLLDIVQLEK
jgi:hypothetical protein